MPGGSSLLVRTAFAQRVAATTCRRIRPETLSVLPRHYITKSEPICEFDVVPSTSRWRRHRAPYSEASLFEGWRWRAQRSPPPRFFGSAGDEKVGSKVTSPNELLGEKSALPPPTAEESEEEPSDKRVEAAQHQLRHRLQEKMGIKAAERATERLLERSGTVRAAETTVKGVETAGANAVGRVAERLWKRAGKAGHAAKSVAGRSTKPALERAGKSAVGHALEAASPKAGRGVAENVAVIATKEGFGKMTAEAAVATAERHALGSVTKHTISASGTEIGIHAAESVGNRMKSKLLDRATSAARGGSATTTELAAKTTTAEHVTKGAAVGGLQRETKRAAAEFIGSHAAEATAEKSLDRVIERGSECIASKDASAIVGRGKAAIAKRLGRRTLIALPLLGGLFAMHICVQDRDRCLHELNSEPRNSASAFLFGSAALCDSVDACAHLLVALGVASGWGNDSILAVEYASLAAAASSIALAIAGEFASRKKADFLVVTSGAESSKKRGK